VAEDLIAKKYHPDQKGIKSRLSSKNSSRLMERIYFDSKSKSRVSLNRNSCILVFRKEQKPLTFFWQ